MKQELSGPTLWLMHTAQFHIGVVARLAEMGVRVTYVCSSAEHLARIAEINPDCILHDAWDAMRGIPPLQAGRSLPPDARLLEQLAPYETVALQMMERLNYSRLRAHELRRYYLQYLACWRGLLDACRPDAVVFQSAPHLGYDYVLYALCQAMGVKTLIVERTYLPDRLILLERVDAMPMFRPELNAAAGSHQPLGDYVESEEDEMLPESPMDGPGRAENYYDARNRQYQLEGNPRLKRVQVLKSLQQPFRAIASALLRQPFQLFKPVQVSVYGLVHPQPRLITALWHQFTGALYRAGLMGFYESRTASPDFTQNYVYFPLHYQPEKSTIPMGGCFGDQLLALDILVRALPPGWLVYVREHPRQFTDRFAPSIRLARNKAFYESLRRDDRVRLISTVESSAALVQHSRCVATITGTTGWEAVERGIPAIVFGTPWFVNCPGVYRVSSVEECTAVLRDIAGGHLKVIPAQVSSFAEWLASVGTFRGYFADLWEKSSGISAEENVRSYAEVIASRIVAPLREEVR